MPSDFKAVEWMRKQREEIDREDEHLGWSEKSEKTVKILADDPVWKRLRNRKVSPKTVSRH